MQASLNYDSIPLQKHLAFWILSVTLTLMYLSLFVFEGHARIEIQTDLEQPTFFKIYWAQGDQAYSETRMGQVQINAREKRYGLLIANLGEIDRLRIDPVEYAAKISLKSLQISQFGYAPLELIQSPDDPKMRPNEQLKLLDKSPESGLSMEALDTDGHLEIDIAPIRHFNMPWRQLFNLSLILTVLALAMRLLQPIITELRFVPYLVGTGLILALLMASMTGLNVHPDEPVHLAAIDYYAKNFLPPPLDADSIRHSFSVYGFSRLDSFEIYYQITGYFQRLIGVFGLDTLTGARVFGLTLFAALFAFCAYQNAFRIFALPLIISAQIWYLFSYANSDGFALALAIFISYQASWPQSQLNRFLTDSAPSYFWLKAIGLGMLLGMLLLLKVNYYFYALFLGLYLLWRVWRGDFPAKKRLWTRIAILFLVGMSLYSVRYALDVHANGWNAGQLQQQMREQYAQTAFKPSTQLSEQFSMLRLKDRGRPLGYVLVTSRWPEKSFISAFGVYGFSQHFGPLVYYDLVRYIGLLLLFALLLALLRSRKKENYVLAIALGLCASGLAAAAIWNSWLNAFQPQGRYLIPILPMLSIFYYHVRQDIIPQLVEWLSILLFLLAVYSFVFVGLQRMASPT